MDTILQKIYSIIEKEKILLAYCHMPNKKGCSLAYQGNYAIAINYNNTKSEKEERQVIAEELAHCLTKTLYQISRLRFAQDKEIMIAEKKAQDYASTLIVPLEALKPLLKILTYYEIAEELNVEEETVLRAIEYYQRKGML